MTADGEVEPRAPAAPPAAPPAPPPPPPHTSHGRQDNWGSGNLQFNVFQADGRLGAELAGVFLLVLLAFGRFVQPHLVPPGAGWQTAANLVALLCLALAATIAFTAGERRSRTTGRLLTAGTALLVLAVAGMSTTHWWLPRPRNVCGSAEIDVDPVLLPRAQALLAAFQRNAAGGSCASALHLAPITSDLRLELEEQGTPVAAVVTADADLLRGLDGGWTSLEARPVARAQWLVVGLDQATVFLSGHSGGAGAQVAAADLPAARVLSAADPVARALLTARPAGPDPWLRAGAILVQQGTCVDDVLVPSATTPPCRPAAGSGRVPVVDGHGNPLGADVLAVPLGNGLPAGGGSDPAVLAGLTVPGPTVAARTATGRFLSLLSHRHGDLGLRAPAATSVQAALETGAALHRFDTPLPVFAAVVLDASLSMGRVGDAGDYDAVAPWSPAAGGVRAWAGSAPLGPGGHLSLVVAQNGHGTHQQVLDGLPTAETRRRLLRSGPTGETGLPSALAAVHRLTAKDGARRRTYVVLVTDGVNVFTERHVRPADLDGVYVLVVGGAGCAHVPAAVARRCRPVSTEAGHVADQLSTLVPSPVAVSAAPVPGRTSEEAQTRG